LKPNDTERTNQPEQCAGLKLPLANDRAFLGEKGERKKGGEDDRRTDENRVNTGPDIEQSDNLRDLVNDVGQTRNEAGAQRAKIQLRTAIKLKQGEWNDCEAGDRVTVKFLRPRIVKSIQIKQEKRRHRPNGDGGEHGPIPS